MTSQLFSVNGPMARHVRDLRRALACMSGPTPRCLVVPAPLAGETYPGPSASP